MPGTEGSLGQGTCSAKTRTVLGRPGRLVTLPNTAACEELVTELGMFSLVRRHLEALLWSVSKEHPGGRAEGVDLLSVALEVRTRAQGRPLWLERARGS